MTIASAESTGQGGSLARFKIVNDYLTDPNKIIYDNINGLEMWRSSNFWSCSCSYRTLISNDDSTHALYWKKASCIRGIRRYG